MVVFWLGCAWLGYLVEIGVKVAALNTAYKYHKYNLVAWPHSSKTWLPFSSVFNRPVTGYLQYVALPEHMYWSQAEELLCLFLSTLRPLGYNEERLLKQTVDLQYHFSVFLPWIKFE
jgi:hypothetical protein